MSLMGLRSSIRRATSLINRVMDWRQSRREAELDIVRSSPLFDGLWYLQHYPDVEAAGIDPLRHFMTIGWLEGRDPGPEFATTAYLRNNADVARSRSNPLVHFIEYGYSEGRETFGHRPTAKDAPIRSFDFPAPAPCFSVAPAPVAAPAWTRHDGLDERRADVLDIGGVAVGYCADVKPRAALQEGFARLSRMSGFGEQGLSFDVGGWPAADERLVDAWYANMAQLRMRWQGERFPFVMRAYQCDPSANGAIGLVGDALLCSPLDVFEVHLGNGLFPILIVVLELDGMIRGSQLLAFPSLCRGGLHYAELLHASLGEEGAVDPISHGERLAGRLASVLAGDAEPEVARLAVDLHGADGTSPLFQLDFQAWLARVARVRVLPGGEGDRSPVQSFLRAAVATTPNLARSSEGGTLVVQHDMIPTIAILAEALGSSDGPNDQTMLPLIDAHSDPAQPAIAIEMPSRMIALKDGFCVGQARWPLLRRESGGLRQQGSPPGAIRISRARGLTNAELLFPFSSSDQAGNTGERGSITWLVESGHWDEDQLPLALVAAAQQRGGGADAVAFIGPTAPRTIQAARTGFGDRACCYPDLDSAIAGVGTAMCGHLGAGLILHDNQCASDLARLLDLDQVATASCLLVSVDPRGKSWHVDICDAGALSFRSDGRSTVHASNHLAEHLWRSIYPVAAVSPRFWLAKTPRLKRWTNRAGGQGDPDGLHLCSALVTASCTGHAALAELPHFIPHAGESNVARATVLFG